MRTSTHVVVLLAVISSGAQALAQTTLANRSSVGPRQTTQSAGATSTVFPEGAKLAYVDLDRIAALSSEGKAASAKLQELRSQKTAEVSERSKQVGTLEQKLSQSAMSVLRRIGPQFLKTFPPRVPSCLTGASACPNRWPSV